MAFLAHALGIVGMLGFFEFFVRRLTLDPIYVTLVSPYATCLFWLCITTFATNTGSALLQQIKKQSNAGGSYVLRTSSAYCPNTRGR
ncbi:hypothetical protein DFH09DRAFT_1138932 [Mycena vulgaris]|nr:hypothetical protein DFH09DRAFT_1138932 [Mycena vulgaris]